MKIMFHKCCFFVRQKYIFDYISNVKQYCKVLCLCVRSTLKIVNKVDFVFYEEIRCKLTNYRSISQNGCGINVKTNPRDYTQRREVLEHWFWLVTMPISSLVQFKLAYIFRKDSKHCLPMLKEYYEIVGESHPLSGFCFLPTHADSFTEMHI